MQSIPALYENKLYQEVIRSIDIDNFSAVGDPFIAQILAASYFQLGQYTDALVLLKEIDMTFDFFAKLITVEASRVSRNW